MKLPYDATQSGSGELIRRLFVPLIDRTAPLAGPVAEAGGVLSLGQLGPQLVDYYLAKLSTGNRYRLSRTEIRELLGTLENRNIRSLLGRYLGRLWSADYGVIWRAPARPVLGHGITTTSATASRCSSSSRTSRRENGTEFVPFTHGRAGNPLPAGCGTRGSVSASCRSGAATY